MCQYVTGYCSLDFLTSHNQSQETFPGVSFDLCDAEAWLGFQVGPELLRNSDTRGHCLSVWMRQRETLAKVLIKFRFSSCSRTTCRESRLKSASDNSLNNGRVEVSLADRTANWEKEKKKREDLESTNLWVGFRKFLLQSYLTLSFLTANGLIDQVASNWCQLVVTT